jgi:hypothetical protein
MHRIVRVILNYFKMFCTMKEKMNCVARLPVRKSASDLVGINVLFFLVKFVTECI